MKGLIRIVLIISFVQAASVYVLATGGSAIQQSCEAKQEAIDSVNSKLAVFDMMDDITLPIN